MKARSWVSLASLLIATAGRAETVILEPVKDNTLVEDANGSLSNGAGLHFFAGRVATGGIRRGLVAFDVAGNVPAGVTVTNARLTLHVSRTLGAPADVSLHRALADWGEGASRAAREEGGGAPSTPGDATWIHASFDDRLWSSEGGDFVASASATRSVGGIGDYTWESMPALVADVQWWLDEPETDFGWFVIGNEASTRTTKRFDSHESSAAVRPRLEIEFEPEVATATAMPTPTATPADTPTASPTATPTSVPSATRTTGPVPCVGDCDGSAGVDVAELILAVEIELGRASLDACPALDDDENARATIDELVAAVAAARLGCEGAP